MNKNIATLTDIKTNLFTLITDLDKCDRDYQNVVNALKSASINAEQQHEESDIQFLARMVGSVNTALAIETNNFDQSVIAKQAPATPQPTIRESVKTLFGAVRRRIKA